MSKLPQLKCQDAPEPGGLTRRAARVLPAHRSAAITRSHPAESCETAGNADISHSNPGAGRTQKQSQVFHECEGVIPGGSSPAIRRTDSSRQTNSTDGLNGC